MRRHEWIAKAIADDVAAGRLQPGDALPPQRELADHLGVALGTVTRAYASARRRGLVLGLRRRGTIVAPDQAGANPLASIVSTPPAAVDLAANFPVYGADPDPSAALREIASRPDVRQLLRYPPTEGMLRHRAAGAAWLAMQRISVEPEALILCGGAQHAIFASLAATTRPGDTILSESLTYPGVLAAARVLGLTVHGVEMDDEGLIPEAVDAAFRRYHARALYCVPTLHNPTTVNLSPDRKKAVAASVQRYQRWIIEDEIHRGLVTRPTTSLFEFAPDRTLLVTAVSKAVVGSLRVGFVAAPKALRAALVATVQASVFAVCPLGAELFATWLEDGTLQTTTQKKRAEARKRQQLALEVLGAIDGVLPYSNPTAYHIWLKLPAEQNSEQIAADAAHRGVRLLPASTFAPSPDLSENGVRLCLGTAEDRTVLRRALTTIARLLRTDHEEPSTF